MAQFSDYLEAGYLPGEIRRATYGDEPPVSVLSYELGKRFKFKPKTDIAGKFMTEFSLLKNNPDYLVNANVQLPNDFSEAFSQISPFG